MSAARKRTRDPIFAKIAIYRAKQRETEKAKAACEKLTARVSGKTNYLPTQDERRAAVMYPALLVNDAHAISHPGHIKSYVKTQLESCARRFGPRTGAAFYKVENLAREELEAMFRRHDAEHKRLRRRLGLEQAYTRYVKALCASSNALQRAMASAPVTPEGARALADLMRTDTDLNPAAFEVGLRSLTRAAARLR
jgi:hypothetical protein